MTDWLAFEQVEPFGTPVEDLRSGVIAATIANVHRAKNSRPFSPSDFVPRWDHRAALEERERAEASRAEDIRAFFEARAAADAKR